MLETVERLSKGSTVVEEMVGQTATRERNRYQAPPQISETDFKEKEEVIEEAIRWKKDEQQRQQSKKVEWLPQDHELLDNAEGTYQRTMCEHSLPHSQQQPSRAITAKYKEQARLRVELTKRRLLPTSVDSSGNASAQGGEFSQSNQ